MASARGQRGHNFAFTPKGYQESVRGLQRRFAALRLDDEDRPVHRQSTRWCTPPVSARWSLELTEGADVCLRLCDGRVLVGRCLLATAALADDGIRWLSGFVVLRLWGRTVPTRIARTRIVGAMPVGPHSWQERRAIIERQRRGEPAVLVARSGSRNSFFNS
ncbi:MAG TPA: hypothetical protein PLJ27_05755 [Polyangiaceae bacterium]|jgi:hypothetical protein|nr:MAG: hypothetical protein BWY17_02006 [Deltaproteobacteria bacterium ADurb.Bin207]HNS98791.1 hypothetical protein [Polyangiaceae bacterium]HNZ24227.1 hypothetical protein [Polyangiaceae bacterium]HOD25420.1 hypothetical protein [Polyangiaceae bacterium]HOH01140.1 hypothetical protein [Polyangiaceae bacterium]